MPSRRTTHIQESLEFLQNLERHHRGERSEARITMLRILKEDPELTLREAANLGGLSLRSVKRWWEIYEQEGLKGIIEPQTGPVSSNRIGRDEIEEIRRKLQAGELATLHDVQAWVRDRFGIEYSERGIAKLLQQKLNARRVWIVPERSDEGFREIATAPATTNAPIIPDKVVRFLNRLPLSTDVQTAIETYRDALMALLGEVNRISIYVNIGCDLQEPKENQPDMLILLDREVSVQATGDVTMNTRREGSKPSDWLLDKFRKQGMPVDRFQEPITADYYYEGRAYLGSLFLWRELGKSPISERARNTIALIEPFIIYMLSDLVTRYHYAHPVDRLFHDTLDQMAFEASLSMQERRVVALRMLGHAYKEIADQLGITEDAIKKHLSSVHRKTGTRSYTELFAKYFTPRLNVRETP
jgi:DNA-binding CsgD family transcriptional regulator